MPAACVSWVCSNRSLTVRSPINSESEAIRPPIHPHLIYDADAAAARTLCSMRIRRSRIQNGGGRGEGDATLNCVAAMLSPTDEASG